MPSCTSRAISAIARNPHTLHGSLCPRSRQRTHRPDHEVLKHKIAVRALLTPVVGEIGDLGCGVAAHALEWRVERACGCIVFRG